MLQAEVSPQESPVASGSRVMRPRLSSITPIPGFGQPYLIQQQEVVKDTSSQISLIDSSWPSYDHGGVSMSQPQLPSYGLYSPFNQSPVVHLNGLSTRLGSPAVQSPSLHDAYVAPHQMPVSYRPRVSSPLRHAMLPAELQRSWSNPTVISPHSCSIPPPVNHGPITDPALNEQSAYIGKGSDHGVSPASNGPLSGMGALAPDRDSPSSASDSTPNTNGSTFRDLMPAPRKLPFGSSVKDVKTTSAAAKGSGGSTAGRKRKIEPVDKPVSEEGGRKRPKHSVRTSPESPPHVLETKSKASSACKRKVKPSSSDKANPGRASASRTAKAASVETCGSFVPTPPEGKDGGTVATHKQRQKSKGLKIATSSALPTDCKALEEYSGPVTRRARNRAALPEPVGPETSTAESRSTRRRPQSKPEALGPAPRSTIRRSKVASKKSYPVAVPAKPTDAATSAHKETQSEDEPKDEGTPVVKLPKEKRKSLQSGLGTANKKISRSGPAKHAAHQISGPSLRKGRASRRSTSPVAGVASSPNGGSVSPQCGQNTSCLNCKESHQRCNRTEPSCSRCRDYGLVCLYSTPRGKSSQVQQAHKVFHKESFAQRKDLVANAEPQPKQGPTMARNLGAADDLDGTMTEETQETLTRHSPAAHSGAVVVTGYFPLVYDVTMQKQLETVTEPFFLQYEADIARGCDEATCAKFYLECISAARRDIWSQAITSAKIS